MRTVGIAFAIIIVLFAVAQSPVQTRTLDPVSTTNSTVALANSTATAALQFAPNIQTIGVISSFSGDANRNNGEALAYRETGRAMTPDRGSIIVSSGSTTTNLLYDQWRYSNFWLKAEPNHYVRVAYSDPDGVTGANGLKSNNFSASGIDVYFGGQSQTSVSQQGIAAPSGPPLFFAGRAILARGLGEVTGCF